MSEYQEPLHTLLRFAQNDPDVKWVLIHEYNLLQELVDKEIPTKPNFNEFSHTECSICNVELYKSNGDRYCSNCGQKIDWSDEE